MLNWNLHRESSHTSLREKTIFIPRRDIREQNPYGVQQIPLMLYKAAVFNHVLTLTKYDSWSGLLKY